MNDNLPEGWTFVRLGDVAQINPRHSRELDDSLMVSFAPMAALDEFKPGFKFLEERQLGQVRRGFTHFADGDVLFAKITPCMENGKGAIAKGLRNGIGCGTTELFVIRPGSMVDPEYLYHFFAQPSLRNEARERFTGTAGQARVPKEFIEDLEIPLAPVAEQWRIVKSLGALSGGIDKCCERVVRAQMLLKRIRRAALAAACSGRLTADWRDQHNETNEWPNRKLADLGKVTGGITKNAGRERLSLQVPYLRVANVYENRLELGDVKSIGVTEGEVRRTGLKKGDLLFVEGNGSIDHVGRVALWDGSIKGAVHQNHLIKFRAGPDVLPAYVLLQMMGPSGRSQLVEKATSSAGLNTLSISKISDIDLPVPSRPEQEEVVMRVRNFFNLAATIESRVVEAQGALVRLTPALLASAFRGGFPPLGFAAKPR